MNSAHLYEQLTERNIQRCDAMRWCIWFEMQNTLTHVCGLVWRSHHWINETKPTENFATYDWIKSAFSVCVQSVDIFLQNECYSRQKKKKLAELGWHDTSIYIYTKTELICHPNRRHTFAKLIKNRMKFKMQFTWLHLFLLLNSVFFFFSSYFPWTNVHRTYF